jgi:hypothetical protein
MASDAASQPRTIRDLVSASAPDSVARAATASALAAVAALLSWNVLHYDWLRGYDAWDNSRYTDLLRVHHTLPDTWQTGVWHTPPLFFAVAAVLERAAGAVGVPSDPHRAVQVFDSACVLGIVALTFLVARELFPDSRAARGASLALAAGTPMLIRAAPLYHPEPLAALLTTASLYVLVRALARDRLGLGHGLVAGVLLGLANLTRTWALAAVAAAALALLCAWLWRRERRIAVTAAATLGAAAVLTVPWLAYKTVRFGSPLAYSRPVAAQWRSHGRPAAFYSSLDLGDVFGSPYAPRDRNHLLPVVYSDWWGDYWRYWDVPAALTQDPPILPRSLDRERRYQSYVGIVPSLLVLAGLAGLAIRAVRTRSPALLLVVVSAALLALSFVGFLVDYPKQDGDNIKALYLLNAVPCLALCGGWAFSRLARVHRLALAGLLLLALEGLYLEVPFLVLPT